MKRWIEEKKKSVWSNVLTYNFSIFGIETGREKERERGTCSDLLSSESDPREVSEK